MDNKTFTLDEAHKEFARNSNGEVWNFLQMSSRSKDDNDRMLLAAYASYYHWLEVGNGANFQRAQWLLSRVHSELNRSEDALKHAEICMQLTTEHSSLLKDFDTAYAYEAMARAHALNVNNKETQHFKDLARETGEKISDAESKKLFEEDFSGGNWNGF